MHLYVCVCTACGKDLETKCRKNPRCDVFQIVQMSVNRLVFSDARPRVEG